MEYFDLPKIRHIISILKGASRSAAILQEGLFRLGKLDFSKNDELRSFGKNDTWGGRDCDGWFRFTVTIPPELDGKEVRFHVETGREGLWNAVNPQFLAYVNGTEVCGLDTNHRDFPLKIFSTVKAGERYCIDLDAWSGMVTKRTTNSHGNANEPILTRCSLLTVEAETEKLYWNLSVPCDVAEQLPENDYRRIRILDYLIKAVNLLDLRQIGSTSYHNSVSKALHYLDTEFYDAYCGNTEGNAYSVGHTHIDVAWQWTYSHTRRKAARSFATVLHLMDRYLEYRFVSSQPQLYEYVKLDHPNLYARIREKIQAGLWEAEGGMWVEADCNLSSGESLIRQFLYGKRFFQEEFGVDSRILWLPDVFGYSAALPQICKKCGVDYFLTSKLSWNDTNKFPYDTFLWKGIDGTEILSHFISTRDYVGRPTGEQSKKERVTTYNGMLEAKQVMGGWERYQQKDISSGFLLPYGYGDGGGGTTSEMMEQALRLEQGIPGCPRVRQTKALDFFQLLEREVSEGCRLPHWLGELYLEFHRGTYTSIAKNKRNNRFAEFEIQGAEVLSVLEQDLLPNKISPANTFADCWKGILLNQFHDVLPGSSIQEVYEDTDRIYAELFAKLRHLTYETRGRIAPCISRPDDSYVVWNTLGYRRNGYVIVDWPQKYRHFHLKGAGGIVTPVQRTFDGQALFYAPEIPGMGYTTFQICQGELAPTTWLKASSSSVENNFFRLHFNEKGMIDSIWDREAQREIIPEGQYANQLETYEDRPHCYDAWEIEAYHADKKWLVGEPTSFELLEVGSHRAVYRTQYRYLDSSLEQFVVVYAQSRRIDFITTADWHQHHILLKAAFPTDILASNASYEIQFGAVERPTHYNTTWDVARFETCAQKWADLSEDGYGVALLNDCKYGYDIHNSVLRLSLIKAATFPNPSADQGRHLFTYSLLPHLDGWRGAGVSRQAYDLNVPLSAQLVLGAADGLPTQYSLLECDNSNINADTFKPAEDGEGTIVRLYEAFGRRTHGTLRFSPKIRHVWECDMLENILCEIPLSLSQVTTTFHPYEIKTLRCSS